MQRLGFDSEGASVSSDRYGCGTLIERGGDFVPNGVKLAHSSREV